LRAPLALVAVQKKFPPNNLEKLAGWVCEVVSGMFSFGGGGGWTGGNCGKALVKPKNQPGGFVLAH